MAQIPCVAFSPEPSLAETSGVWVSVAVTLCHNGRTWHRVSAVIMVEMSGFMRKAMGILAEHWSRAMWRTSVTNPTATTREHFQVM